MVASAFRICVRPYLFAGMLILFIFGLILGLLPLQQPQRVGNAKPAAVQPRIGVPIAVSTAIYDCLGVRPSVSMTHCIPQYVLHDDSLGFGFFVCHHFRHADAQLQQASLSSEALLENPVSSFRQVDARRMGRPQGEAVLRPWHREDSSAGIFCLTQRMLAISASCRPSERFSCRLPLPLTSTSLRR